MAIIQIILHHIKVIPSHPPYQVAVQIFCIRVLLCTFHRFVCHPVSFIWWDIVPKLYRPRVFIKVIPFNIISVKSKSASSRISGQVIGTPLVFFFNPSHAYSFLNQISNLNISSSQHFGLSCDFYVLPDRYGDPFLDNTALHCDLIMASPNLMRSILLGRILSAIHVDLVYSAY